MPRFLAAALLLASAAAAQAHHAEPASPGAGRNVVFYGGAAVLLACAGVLGAAAASNRKPPVLLAPVLIVAVLAGACADSGGAMPNRGTKSSKEAPAIASSFLAFKHRLELDWDDDHLFVGSDAFPDHRMMVGIMAWQQQVPLPQPYHGANSWRIPLRPVTAKTPLSLKKNLFRGAVALAANGVPIFNPLNNRGDDAFLAGELDEFGGHCGRGDDYHYHLPPVHLEKAVGKGQPIAFALDGYPVMGYADADGKEPTDLDECGGRHEAGGYRYYSLRKYPYLIGAMRGVVGVRGGQVDPQPKDAPVRPGQEPLRGAKVTGFKRDDKKKSYAVEYSLRGNTHAVRWTVGEGGTFDFAFVDGDGKVAERAYRRRGKR